MSTFLVFAGTTEGRRLVEFLNRCGEEVCASVATEYGKALLPKEVKVFSDRLNAEEMTTMFQSLRFDCVIDATHPYADQVTENISAACAASNTRYLRLIRPASAADGCVYVENAQKAAEVLCATTGKVLLTTGSKELDLFTKVPDFQSRIFPRVLPSVESIQRCLALGFPARNVIAMQGPFTREMNGALLRQTGASILVTKESGEAGGFAGKIYAARDAGAISVVIGRPGQETGYTFEEVVSLLREDYDLAPIPESKGNPLWFPLFVDLAYRKIIVFGAGTIATRRIKALAPYCHTLTVVAPLITPELETVAGNLLRRPYLRGDCIGQDFVIAATDDREVNHAIFEEAKAAGIPVNVADAPEECSFYFPAVIRKENVVIGVTSGGTDHGLVKAVAERIRSRVDELIPSKEKPDE